MTKKTYKNVFFPLFSSQNKFGGFTLIELLVVVLIIGILAAVALPKYEVSVAKSRYAQLIIAAENIKKANQIYQMANGHYTMDMHNLDLSITNCEPSDDGRHCLLRQGNRRMVCYLNDGSTDSSGNLKPINYCTIDQMYYTSRYDGSKECWANTGNKVANQVCLSMGGVFLREGSNGLTGYRLP